MEFIILQTGKDDEEIQKFCELTMAFESEEMKDIHYVGFARESTAYSSAHCNNILRGTDMLDAFSKANELSEVISLYPKANYSFIPVVHHYVDQYDVQMEQIDGYLSDIVKANDEYYKVHTVVMEFGDFNELQEKIFADMKAHIEKAFEKSPFINKVVVLLDYKHPFHNKTFFI